MKKILVVVDMQNDFIDGTLGTKEALSIVENVKNKIKSYEVKNIYATRDTHKKNYLETQEGVFLPVEHCVEGTSGWEIRSDIAQLLQGATFIDKNTFGSVELAKIISEQNKNEQIEIELVGLCTDICVVSNAIILKSMMPNTKITVDSSCCAGVSKEKHLAAIETMKSCQIQVN